jgi:hypothetical protein
MIHRSGDLDGLAVVLARGAERDPVGAGAGDVEEPVGVGVQRLDAPGVSHGRRSVRVAWPNTWAP